MQRKPKIFQFTGLALVVLAVVAVASAFALEKSLPYRIGPNNYAHYLWARRLSLAALVIPFIAMGVGVASRQRLPLILGASSLLVAFVFMPGGVHSGPNPEAWCYNNLRKIDGAKEQFEQQNHLTNGAAITGEEISPYIEGGFSNLKCYEHGKYIIGAIGTEPRCSYHGSMSEMEAGTSRK